MIKNLFFIWILFAFALTSCEYKDLCDDHPHAPLVYVQFDWEHTRVTNEGPSLMEVWFYPIKGGEPLRYQITNSQGGYIRIPTGEYKVLCYNGDSETFSIRDTESFESFFLTTFSTRLLSPSFFVSSRADEVLSPPKPVEASEEDVIMQPDWIAGGSETYISVKNDMEGQVITLHPEEKVINIKIIIRNVPNLEYTAGLSGALSGLSSGWYLGLSYLRDDRNIIPFDIYQTGEKEISAQFMTFGHCPFEANKHIFSLYVIMVDGQNLVYNYNVTDQMHDAEQNKEYLEIILDDIPIPSPTGGFTPNVSEWEDEIINL